MVLKKLINLELNYKNLKDLELPLKTIQTCNTLSNQKARQLPKTKVLSKGHRNQPEEALTSQKWDNMRINTENNSII